MSDESTATKASLLIRIRDPKDADAWARFVAIYAPLVYGFARRRGLQDADAADLTQDVLQAVSSVSGRLRYDPSKGAFRNWLFTVSRNKLNTFLGKRRQDMLNHTPLDRHADSLATDLADEEVAWTREYEARLFAWASEQVRETFEETTWRAFWRTAVDGESPKDVAGALGISVGAVYIAKSRVLSRIKERIQELPSD